MKTFALQLTACSLIFCTVAIQRLLRNIFQSTSWARLEWNQHYNRAPKPSRTQGNIGTDKARAQLVQTHLASVGAASSCARVEQFGLAGSRIALWTTRTRSMKAHFFALWMGSEGVSHSAHFSVGGFEALQPSTRTVAFQQL